MERSSIKREGRRGEEKHKKRRTTRRGERKKEVGESHTKHH